MRLVKLWQAMKPLSDRNVLICTFTWLQAISQSAYRGEQRQVQFKVVFPPHSNDYDVPRVKNVVINGQSFCSNNQVYSDTRTTIELKYSLKTGLNLPLATGYEFSIVGGNPSKPGSSETPWTQQPIPYQPPLTVTQQPPYQPITVLQTRRPRPRPTTTPVYEEYVDNVPVYGQDEFQVNGLNCGVPKVLHNFLVLGGTEARKGQWPWHAALYMTSGTGSKFRCGGTLVSKRHVITAAHCVVLRVRKAVAVDSLLIYLGKHNLKKYTEEEQQAKDVDRIIVHPNYGNNKSQNYDVSILILSTSVVFSEFVIPVCLWDRSSSLNEVIGIPGSVIGWGLDDEGGVANVLRTAKMPVVSQEVCLRSGEFYNVYTSDVTFCAGYRNGTSVCNGDSGGGMFFFLDNPNQQSKTWYTRGVVSLSKPQNGDLICDSNNYVVFTDLAKMLPWLHQQLVPPVD